MGQKLNAVILGISHFSKGTNGGCDSLQRVTGSIAFGALARILVTAKMTDSNGQEKRVLVRTKCNHGRDGGRLNYQIEQRELVEYPGVSSSHIIWDAAVS